MFTHVCENCKESFETPKRVQRFCSLKCAGKYSRVKHVFVDGVEYKRCSKCKELLSLEHFYRHPHSSDGLAPLCTKCKSDEAKALRIKQNPEHINRHKLTLEEKKIRTRENSRKSYLKRKEKLGSETFYEFRKEDRKVWRAKNKDRIRMYRAARKTKKKNALVHYSKEEWDECVSYFNHRCAYCGESEFLTQDHFYPLSKGGEYTKENIIPACHSCNSSKGNKNFFEWYPTQSFYDIKRENVILKYLHYKGRQQQMSMLFEDSIAYF